MPNNQLLRAKQAAQLLNCGRSTLWRWTKTLENFPQPQKISPRITAWRESDLIAWINQKFSKEGDHE